MSARTRKIDTLIIGGGQAGLAASYTLTQAGLENLILEQAGQVGNAWRNDRWDSFTLVTPNWSLRLPGANYQGSQPDGYLPRVDLLNTLEHYVENFQLPLQLNTRVLGIDPDSSGAGWSVQTDRGSYLANQVIMATGMFQYPRVPKDADQLPKEILQLHSGKYRNPGSLPPGAVLVVGSAQSGSQIAEELLAAGREVFLCTCTAGRVPRRYQGKDIFDWLLQIGFFDRTVDQLPSPQARFRGNPHLSGKGGGHTINLHQFARLGMGLLGHLRGIQEGVIHLAPDLHENLAKADAFEAEVVKAIHHLGQVQGLNLAVEDLPHFEDGFQLPETESLDLQKAGVSTVIWALGYRFDFSLVHQPVFDEWGYPIQERGVTNSPGLYFLGLPWLPKLKSGLFVGIGDDAEYIASHIANRHS